MIRLYEGTVITIKEIADMLNVSTTTVSNVINGKTKKVSKENVEKIKQVLKETNYIPRMGLRALNNSSSMLIGVVIYAPGYYENTVVFDPFYNLIIGRLEQVIRESGYFMMLYIGKDLDDIFKMSLAWNIDGLITVSFTQNDHQKLQSLINKPMVGIDCHGILDDSIVSVCLDDKDGGYQITKYLINNGYRNILFIRYKAMIKGIDIDDIRLEGYAKALEEYDIPFKKENCIYLNNITEKRMSDYKQLLKFMKKDYAMFFSSDFVAVEAMGYFLEHKFSIPEDISIVGYDDNMYSKLSTPKLTTVHQDVLKKAENAMDLLFRLLKNETIECNTVRLPINLAIRGSVKPLVKP